MKICILADGQSIHITRWCSHFYERGHEVHLISFSNVTIPGIQVHFMNSGAIDAAGKNWKVLLRFKDIKKCIQQIKPDVLHAMYATSYGFMGALSGFHPYIVTPLGSDILISPKESFLYRTLLKYTFKKADWITSMAPHMTDAMLQLGVSKKKIGNIIFGINTVVFNKEKRQLSTEKFYITSTRNFEPVYNIPHFLNAIALIKNEIPNLMVVMLGDGSLKQEFIDLSKELKLENCIAFLGKVPQAKVVEILNSTHISVTVSLSDGNSLSLIEAMACGAYPIATDIPANHEWLKDGVNGSFVKINDVQGLADVMLKVYRNFDSMIDKAIQESAKIIAEKGTWQINMLNMENKYKEIASCKK
jgi:L-malate glycosyltransferase